MISKNTFLTTIFVLGAITAKAQDNCDAANAVIAESVQEICQSIGENEVCYGNNTVNAVPREGILDFTFNAPGDSTDLSSIRSLYLSAFNSVDNTGGVAQLRMLLNTQGDPQDVTMLLFGDVKLDSAVEEVEGISVIVSAESATIFNLPAAGSLQLATINKETTLRALGRLDNNAWVRVEVPDSGDTGWVLAGFIAPAEGQSLDTLPTQSGEAAYFGPMQAFYYQSGTSADCPNSVSDGLLIQTPEGVARVSLLINEVSIELTSSASGASAFIQADPETEGMAVSVLDGTAYVETAEGRQTVQAGQQTHIAISTDLTPLSAPSLPQIFDQSRIQSIPLLPVVRDPSRPIQPESSPLPASSAASAIGNVASRSSTSSQGSSGTSNQPQSSSSGSQSSSNTPSSSGSQSGTTRQATPTPGAETDEQSKAEIHIIDVILAILAIVAGVAFVFWMIVRSRSQQT